jgi:glycosyltransferase involved in cell wall biosynthesis
MGKAEWARLLQTSRILVSPSTSDGTPNGLLEAMACGTFPVFGNIESIREWIEHGTNGLLCDPESPASIRDELHRALTDDSLFAASQVYNRQLVETRADYSSVMPEVRKFYESVVERIH